MTKPSTSPLSTWVLSAGLLAGAGLGLTPGCATPGPPQARGACDDFDLDVEKIWGNAKRREVRDGLRTFAGESQVVNVDRIVTKMDAITTDWVMMNRRACKDTLERQTMPEEIYVRVSLCLNTALVQQRTLITQLGEVDRTSYEHIDRAMLDISENIATCQNQAVLAYYKTPEETADSEAAQTADSKTAEAKTLLALGKSEAASGLLNDAAIAAKRSGDERRSLDATIAACNHAVLQGEYDKAIVYGAPSLTQAQKLGYAIGEADALTCLGTAELRRGNHEEARTHLESAMRQRESFFGKDHPRVADAANRLGNLEAAVASYKTAHELYMRALDIWTKTFGADDPVTSRAYHNLGFVHIGLDDVEGAVAWYQKAIEAETRSLGKDHPATALSEANYASVLLLQEKIDDAYALLNHAIEVQQRILGPGHPEVAVSLHGIGEVWAARKGYASALEWYAKALTLRKLAFGEHHLETAKTLDAMATAHYKLKQYDEANTLAEQALKVREDMLGPDNIVTATSYFNCGLIAEKRKKYKDALRYYEKSLLVEDKVRGPGHVLTKQTRAAVNRLGDLVNGR
ncbi:tetratricopeptide repeat protein [Enhygromyxa salina]|uniref:Tetratricopeptide repeat protein n=1 Tax=Enhygromyxa salina TaxID=215803 RepID=A0A2S9YYH8_9BACT|nr:tetratricopeptide repeat protein [Enhygromyxa salina]PRQ10136.1 Tetratricopeptide repeat protein [Enhygromyxa salina]